MRRNETPLVTGPNACIVCDGFGWVWMPSYWYGTVPVACESCESKGRVPKKRKAAV